VSGAANLQDACSHRCPRLSFPPPIPPRQVVGYQKQKNKSIKRKNNAKKKKAVNSKSTMKSKKKK
jgi:hypothetical protein